VPPRKNPRPGKPWDGMQQPIVSESLWARNTGRKGVAAARPCGFLYLTRRFARCKKIDNNTRFHKGEQERYSAKGLTISSRNDGFRLQRDVRRFCTATEPNGAYLSPGISWSERGKEEEKRGFDMR
jgi:hypothetical protein